MLTKSTCWKFQKICSFSGFCGRKLIGFLSNKKIKCEGVLGSNKNNAGPFKM